jgi:hypothetical protein
MLSHRPDDFGNIETVDLRFAMAAILMAVLEEKQYQISYNWRLSPRLLEVRDVGSNPVAAKSPGGIGGLCPRSFQGNLDFGHLSGN